jgi:hypothetical protein
MSDREMGRHFNAPVMRLSTRRHSITLATNVKIGHTNGLTTLDKENSRDRDALAYAEDPAKKSENQEASHARSEAGEKAREAEREDGQRQRLKPICAPW